MINIQVWTMFLSGTHVLDIKTGDIIYRQYTNKENKDMLETMAQLAKDMYKLGYSDSKKDMLEHINEMFTL